MTKFVRDGIQNPFLAHTFLNSSSIWRRRFQYVITSWLVIIPKHDILHFRFQLYRLFAYHQMICADRRYYKDIKTFIEWIKSNNVAKIWFWLRRIVIKLTTWDGRHGYWRRAEKANDMFLVQIKYHDLRDSKDVWIEFRSWRLNTKKKSTRNIELQYAIFQYQSFFWWESFDFWRIWRSLNLKRALEILKKYRTYS